MPFPPLPFRPSPICSHRCAVVPSCRDDRQLACLHLPAGPTAKRSRERFRARTARGPPRCPATTISRSGQEGGHITSPARRPHSECWRERQVEASRGRSSQHREPYGAGECPGSRLELASMNCTSPTPSVRRRATLIQDGGNTLRQESCQVPESNPGSTGSRCRRNQYGPLETRVTVLHVQPAYFHRGAVVKDRSTSATVPCANGAGA